MKSAKQLISTAAIKEGMKYLDKDPMGNFPKLINWAEKFAVQDNHKKAIQTFREIYADPDNNWNHLIQRVFNEVNKNSVLPVCASRYRNAPSGVTV